jgi:hypothetical protein
MNIEQWELTIETQVLGEAHPNATLSTTNPTRPELGSKRVGS